MLTRQGQYLGTLDVSDDIAAALHPQKLEGENRGGSYWTNK